MRLLIVLVWKNFTIEYSKILFINKSNIIPSSIWKWDQIYIKTYINLIIYRMSNDFIKNLLNLETESDRDEEDVFLDGHFVFQETHEEEILVIFWE